VISPPIDPVATVADRPIPLAWVEQRLSELRRGRLGRHLPPGEGDETLRLRRWIVHELVTQAVLRHEAERAGLLPMPGQAREGRARGVDTSAPRDAGPLPDDVARRLFDAVTSHVVVDEAAMRAFHERNIDVFRRPEARLIRLQRSMPTGEHPSASVASEMWLRRGELVGPLEDAVFAADVDEVVGPFELGQGRMSARLLAVMPASCLTFEEARAGIEADLLRAARGRAFEDWIASRRDELATIEPAYEHPGHPLHGLPRHRH
jgi:[acyl-carrier-protein] S-malonyltransferase